MILIFAGSYEQARICARNAGLQPKEWFYVSSLERIMGLKRGVAEAWLYGSWRNRDDAVRILEQFTAKDIPTKHVQEKH